MVYLKWHRVCLKPKLLYVVMGLNLLYAVEVKDAVKGSSMPKDSKSSWLLDGSSSYLLTYQDKHGNWMFVGDAPWQVFVKSVKRLRIAKG